jgi:hypothetical protein
LDAGGFRSRQRPFAPASWWLGYQGAMRHVRESCSCRDRGGPVGRSVAVHDGCPGGCPRTAGAAGTRVVRDQRRSSRVEGMPRGRQWCLGCGPVPGWIYQALCGAMARSSLRGVRGSWRGSKHPALLQHDTWRAKPRPASSMHRLGTRVTWCSGSKVTERPVGACGPDTELLCGAEAHMRWRKRCGRDAGAVCRGSLHSGSSTAQLVAVGRSRRPPRPRCPSSAWPARDARPGHSGDARGRSPGAPGRRTPEIGDGRAVSAGAGWGSRVGGCHGRMRRAARWVTTKLALVVAVALAGTFAIGPASDRMLAGRAGCHGPPDHRLGLRPRRVAGGGRPRRRQARPLRRTACDTRRKDTR